MSFLKIVFIICLLVCVSCKSEFTFDAQLNRYIGSTVHSKGIDTISAVYLIQMDDFDFIHDLAELKNKASRLPPEFHRRINDAIWSGRVKGQDLVGYNLDLGKDIPFAVSEFYVVVFVDETSGAFTQIKIASDAASEIGIIEYLGVDQPQLFNNKLPLLAKEALGHRP